MSARRGAPEWLLNINRFGAQSPTPTTVDATAMKEVDVEKNNGSTGGADNAMLEVPGLPVHGHSRKNSNESIGGTKEAESSSLDGKKTGVVVAAEAVFIPDNLASGDGNESELYRRRPVSATSKSTTSTGNGHEEGHMRAITPLKNVHFPAPRE
jgi:hypothetical protein